MGASGFHKFSNWLENILSRHQYMISAVTALSAVAVVVIAFRILLLARQQTIARRYTNQIAGIGLLVGNRDRLSDHVGYLCYRALLGGRLSMDSLDAPQNGLSVLLDALDDNDAGSLNRLKDHPQATQFRTKAAIMRSPEMHDLIVEINDLIMLADHCGCPTMIDGRITDLYTKNKKSVTFVRGPGPQL